MNGKLVAAVVVTICLMVSPQIFSQQKLNLKKNKEVRNKWGLGLVYSERGFGPSSSIYVPLSKNSELLFNLSFSGVADSREIDYVDIYGNTFTPNKVNRVYMMPLSIGVRTELFKDDLDGQFSPYINAGVSPALVFINPYDKGFFRALGYTQTKFALGGFAGIGVNFTQSKDFSISANLNYYYLPILNGSVQSVKNNIIDNLGGLQLMFGINFLK